jgi:hypothetical protein
MVKIIRNLFITSVFMLLAIIVAAPSAAANPVNLALNPSGVGMPSPLESTPGWGGGSYPWEIVDGQRGYAFWAHGLAFPWNGTYSPGGTNPIESQATIAFAGPVWFNEVILWQHGYYPTSLPLLDYWDGSSWNPIAFSRELGTMSDVGSISDIYTFGSVFGSKVRWTIPANSTFNDGAANHGWIYEFEVYQDPVPEPTTLLLLGTGLGFVAITAIRRKK